MRGTTTKRDEGRGTLADPRASLIAHLPVKERRLELEGVSTAVLEGGEGPPLVVLHGPGEFAARWFRTIPQLAASHRVILPDLPGHGTSEVQGGSLGPERVSSWLDALIERTCDDPPALVGHILGGAIGARFAVARPERIRSLVLVDSLGLAPFRPAPRFALSLFAFMVVPSEPSYRRMMGQCEHDRDRLAEEMGEAWAAVRDYSIERARDPRTKVAVRTLMRTVGMPPIPPADLEGLRVPTALIWGRHDKALRLSIAEEASERYGWPLHIIEDTADDAPLEQPEAFVAALRTALATSDPRGAAATRGPAGSPSRSRDGAARSPR